MHNIRVFVQTPGRTTTTFAICGFRDALNFHFSDNAVIRPLRTATRRSWQPGGFGDSCLPDGIFHGALDYRFVEVMPTPDAVSRSM